jgi:hypothetical protein
VDKNVTKEHTASIFNTSALKMEAVFSSKTLVSTFKSTRRYNPEDQNRQFYCDFVADMFNARSLLRYLVVLQSLLSDQSFGAENVNKVSSD